MKTILRSGTLLVALALLAALLCPLAAAQTGSTVVVDITNFGPDMNRQAFRGTFTINEPNKVNFLVYEVEDAESGGSRFTDRPNVGGFSARAFEIPFAQLTPGREYRLVVRAFDFNEEGIPRAGENFSQDPARQYILAEKTFKYETVEREFAFTIDSIIVEPGLGRLILNLTVPTDFEILKYDGFIKDESGQQVGVIPGALFTGPSVVQPMPDRMRAATEEGEYTATLRLYTEDDRQAEQSYEFGYKPPAPPGLLARIGAALAANRTITWLIAGVVAVAGVAAIWTGTRPKRYLPPFDRPQNASTLPDVPQVRRPRVLLRVVQSPGTRARAETITRFPCTVGKGDQADIKLADPRVSRKHLEISLRDGHFYLTDLNSLNGTWVNDTQLRANGNRQVTGAVSVRLGEDTVLDIETGV